jgi:hypothetical protein
MKTTIKGGRAYLGFNRRMSSISLIGQARRDRRRPRVGSECMDGAHRRSPQAPVRYSGKQADVGIGADQRPGRPRHHLCRDLRTSRVGRASNALSIVHTCVYRARAWLATTDMSIAAMSVRWLCRKLRQVGEGTLGRHVSPNCGLTV